MTRRVPILATLVVLAAVATMIALGFWQLGRMREKEAQLGVWTGAQALSSAVPWPARPADYGPSLYRRSMVECATVEGIAAQAGHSASGETGWAHVARCRLPGGEAANVALGWSRDPRSPEWTGGSVGGCIGPSGDGIKLVAAPAQAGLADLAPPNPRDVPNNHWSYAIQWFLFALTALVIYVLALRKRWRSTPA